MTSVYEVNSDSRYFDQLEIGEDSDWELIDLLETPGSIASSWSPIRVSPAGLGDSGLVYPRLGDHPYLTTNLPVFSARAAGALRDLIDPCAELLPLECDYGEFVGVNILHGTDAFAERESEFEALPDGQIMLVSRFMFRAESINSPFFTIPQLFRSYFFATEEFVSRIKCARLEGFCLERVWSDDAD